MRTPSPLLLTALCCAAVGCGLPGFAGPVPAAAPFGTASARIEAGRDRFSLQVRVARSPAQRAVGLQGRRELGEGEGMIFLFDADQPPGTAFWMRGVEIPLSIAFLDSAGVIVETREMSPCRAPLPFLCRRYRSKVPFRAALEVERGYFARRGIGVGHRVRLGPDPD